jgi:hypothetical protein
MTDNITQHHAHQKHEHAIPVNKNVAPPTEHEITDLKVKDYAESLTTIAKQLHILEHALPLNKTEEIETAYKLMRNSVNDLRVFLTVRGFDI